jgi:predicted NBD/HSP70 family sugar kinase
LIKYFIFYSTKTSLGVLPAGCVRFGPVKTFSNIAMTEPIQPYSVFSTEAVAGVAYKNRALKRAIIQLLDGRETSTVMELSRELNISVPKAASLVSEMTQDGLLCDYGKIDSTGGRKASVYGLIPDACFFIGVDVRKYYVNIGLLDFKKNLQSVRERVPFRLENTPESLRALIDIIRDFIASFPDRRDRILGVGLNLSGRINQVTGHSYSFFHFQEEPLSRIIAAEIGIPVYLENDSRSMAYGEFMGGVVGNERNVLFINIDFGLGMGILIDGEIYYGKSGFSGELGHIPFFQNERICHCGKRGCLETETSGLALLAEVRERIRNGSSSILAGKYPELDKLRLEDVIEAARNEDTLVIEVLAELGEKLGKAIAILINVFNPELVILGGRVSETGELIRLPIRSALQKYSLGLVNNDTQLRLSLLGERAGVMGGCLIARGKVVSGVN